MAKRLYEMTSFRRFLKTEIWILIALWGVSISVAYLFRNSTTQHGAFVYHINLMNYYNNDSEDRTMDYPLYPLWGYPLVLMMFQNYNDIIYFQAFAGGTVLFIFYSLIRKNLFAKNRQRLWLILVLTALPFYSMLSVKWPAAFQLTFLLASTSALYLLLEKKRTYYAAIAGVFQGLACNFRSEYIYYPLFLLVIYLFLKLAHLVEGNKSILKGILLYCASSYILMIPLGLERYHRTGTYNIKTGNSDFVNLFFSIGQYSGNSMGLQFEDGWIEDYLHENIQDEYDPSTPLHMQAVANNYCRAQYFNYVKSDPINYFGKIFHNLKSELLGGFYCGQLEKLFPEEYQYNIILIKEYYKTLIGNQNYDRNMALLYDHNLIANRYSISIDDLGSIGKILPAISYYALNTIYIVVLWITLLFIPIDAVRYFRSRIRISMKDIILLAPLVYASFLMALGLYENRFTSMVYIYIVAYLALKVPLRKAKENSLNSESNK